MTISENDLDHAFAEHFAESIDFRRWLLSGGRFARYAETALLLSGEQADARKAKHWWKHWWCRLPDGLEGETDIFAVFEVADKFRFAVHIENKPSHGKLLLKQAAGYRPRAAYKAFDPRWLDYQDFETILLAPNEFLDRSRECSAQFDRTISYEDVATFVPLYGVALGSAET